MDKQMVVDVIDIRKRIEKIRNDVSEAIVSQHEFEAREEVLREDISLSISPAGTPAEVEDVPELPLSDIAGSMASASQPKKGGDVCGRTRNRRNRHTGTATHMHVAQMAQARGCRDGGGCRWPRAFQARRATGRRHRVGSVTRPRHRTCGSARRQLPRPPRAAHR